MKPSSSLAPPVSSPGTKRKLLEEPCKRVESKLDSSCVAKSATLPSSTVEYLKAWIMSPDHMLHPYPTDIEKADIMRATGIEMKQLTNWFTNNRKRFWKPRIAAMRENGTIKFDGSACPAAGATSVPGSTGLVGRNSPVDISDRGAACVGGILGQLDYASDSNQNSQSGSIPAGKLKVVTPPYPAPVVHKSNSSSSISTMDFSPCKHSLHKDTVDANGLITRHETIDIHIMTSSTGEELPSVKDVTILAPKQSHRLLASYKQRRIAYRFHTSLATDRKKVQRRRDAEVVRIKKQMLKYYLSTLKTEESEATSKKASSSGRFVAQMPKTTKKKNSAAPCAGKANVIHSDGRYHPAGMMESALPGAGGVVTSDSENSNEYAASSSADSSPMFEFSSTDPNSPSPLLLTSMLQGAAEGQSICGSSFLPAFFHLLVLSLTNAPDAPVIFG